jgi:hypothetical protein
MFYNFSKSENAALKMNPPFLVLSRAGYDNSLNRIFINSNKTKTKLYYRICQINLEGEIYTTGTIKLTHRT